MAKAAGYVSTMRPLNSIGTGLGIALTLSMFSGWRPGFNRVLIGFLTGFAGASSAMMINDYVDRETDRVNKPWKPIPRGIVNPNIVLAIGASLYVLTIALNLTLGLEVLLVTTIYATISIIYSLLRRFWWSQLLVPLSTTSILIYSYVSSSKPAEFTGAVAVLSASIYLANLAREVAKAIQDYEGDRKAGYSTIPIRFGLGPSMSVAFVSGAIAVALNYVVCPMFRVSPIYPVLITLANLLFARRLIRLYVSYTRVNTPPTRSELEAFRRESLYSFLLAIIAYSTLKIPM